MAASKRVEIGGVKEIDVAGRRRVQDGVAIRLIALQAGLTEGYVMHGSS